MPLNLQNPPAPSVRQIVPAQKRGAEATRVVAAQAECRAALASWGPRWRAIGAGLEAVALEPPIQCAPGKAQSLRRLLHVAFRALQGLLDEDALHLFQGEVLEGRQGARPGIPTQDTGTGCSEIKNPCSGPEKM